MKYIISITLFSFCFMFASELQKRGPIVLAFELSIPVHKSEFEMLSMIPKSEAEQLKKEHCLKWIKKHVKDNSKVLFLGNFADLERDDISDMLLHMSKSRAHMIGPDDSLVFEMADVSECEVQKFRDEAFGETQSLLDRIAVESREISEPHHIHQGQVTQRTYEQQNKQVVVQQKNKYYNKNNNNNKACYNNKARKNMRIQQPQRRG